MKEKKVTLETGVYTVTELTMRQAMPIMETENKSIMAVEMVKLAVALNGAPLGDAALDFPFSEFQLLLEAVNEVHGFDSQDQD